ncbi:hypothetical protein SK128_026690 [Halocaridina rubra]|uniref:Uncharacterized protein n=1 Tax=Halocaridina rubra TaxID=373956 RepID=A0AAN8ZQU4_HALRR
MNSSLCEEKCTCCLPPVMPTTIRPQPEICKNTSSCVSAGGFCDFQCPPDAQMDSSLCEGNCTCCLPPVMPTTMKPQPDICKHTNSCARAGGFCDFQCPPDAQKDSSLCEGNCTCCLPPAFLWKKKVIFFL